MQFEIIPVTHYQQNCSLIWCPKSRSAAVVDPGGDMDQVLTAAAKHKVNIEKILLTHGHMDHVGGTQALREHLKVPVIGPHRDDMFWLQSMHQQASMMGFPPAPPLQPDRWLEQGETLTLGSQTLEVLHCPGHTPGHVVFFNRQAELAWVGDVLFAGSVGRSDFPRGDHETLVASIRQKLWPLGDNVRFIPGHGPMSTFGDERRHNPFVADSRFG